ncbi:MAG: phosphonate metabolism protein PhnP [Neptuniibacter sp.]
MKLTFLGTGNAANVPAYGCSCTVCSKANIDLSYQRHSACALIETEQVTLLIDAGLPELGKRFPPGSIKTILLTHYHMDHVQGLFPMRWGTGLSIDVIGPDDPKGCDDLYKHSGIFNFSTKAQPFQEMFFGQLKITPVPLQHSRPTLGYVVEDGQKCLAYLTDTVGLPEATEAYLKNKNVDLLIVDCSYPPQQGVPKGHNDLNTALKSIESVRPERAYLTHIGHLLDSWFLENPVQLPENVAIARDNLVIEL